MTMCNSLSDSRGLFTFWVFLMLRRRDEDCSTAGKRLPGDSLFGTVPRMLPRSPEGPRQSANWFYSRVNQGEMVCYEGEQESKRVLGLAERASSSPICIAPRRALENLFAAR